MKLVKPKRPPLAPKKSEAARREQEARQALNATRRRREAPPDEVSEVGRPEGLLVLQKGERLHIRVERSEFNDKELVNIREWVKTKKDGWIRTGKGFAVSADSAEEFAESLLLEIRNLLDE